MNKSFGFAAIMLLAACGGENSFIQTQTIPANPSVGVFKRVNGDTLHKMSGVVFPRRIGQYELVNTHNYREDGSEVGIVYHCKYNHCGDHTEMTVFLSHFDVNLDAYVFDMARHVVASEGYEDTWLYFRDIYRPIPQLVDGPFYLFTTEEKGGQYHVGVWGTKMGPWNIRVLYKNPRIG